MKFTRKLGFFVILSILIFAFAGEQKNNNALNIGDKAPSFSAKNESGEIWVSDSLVGAKNLVIYFYPAAMTRGCVKQACAYRDTKDQIQDYDTKVIGVSGDYVETLKTFRDMYQLHFTLLADPDGKIAKKFGVPVSEGGKTVEKIDEEEKEFKRGATFERWTYVIGKDGKIVYKEKNVDPENDSENVLEFIKNLENEDME